MLFKSLIWTILWFVATFQLSAQQFYTELGDQFIPFEKTDINGNSISDTSLKGKPSLIIFFGTRCPPCLRELQELSQVIHPSWQAKLNVVAIGSTDNKDSLVRFKSKTAYPFTFIPDPDQYLFEQIGDYVIPRTFLLDEEGIILRQSVGFNQAPFDDLLAQIDNIIH